MKHFIQTTTFDPTNISKELDECRWWNWLNIRRNAYNSQHLYVDDIVLRFQPIQEMPTFDDFMNKTECVDFFVQQYLPSTMNLIRYLTKGHEIGRIVVAKLKAGGVIGNHIDEGDYHKEFSRYHMVISTNDKVIFTCEQEKQHMPQGTVWWFNNRVTHLSIGQTNEQWENNRKIFSEKY